MPARLERRFVTAASLAVALTSLGVLVVAGVIDHVDAERDQLRAQHQRAANASLLRARDDLGRATRPGEVCPPARARDLPRIQILRGRTKQRVKQRGTV